MPGIILDAGPCLNFFATNNERLLISVLGRQLATPSTVKREVLRKAKTDDRFEVAGNIFKKLERADIITVLSDDDANDPGLLNATVLVTNRPLAQVLKQAKDLGETMVVIHALKEALQGANVSVIIDDQGGAELATAAMETLDRLRHQGQSVGTLRLYNTARILMAAVGKGIPDRNSMRRIYKQLRAYDDGLVHIDQTELLSSPPWP